MLNDHILRPHSNGTVSISSQDDQGPSDQNSLSAIQHAYFQYRDQMDRILQNGNANHDLSNLNGTSSENSEIAELKRQVSLLSQRLNQTENQVYELSSKYQKVTQEKDALEARFNAEILQLRTLIMTQKRDLSSQNPHFPGTSEFSMSRETSSEPLDLNHLLQRQMPHSSDPQIDSYASEPQDIKPFSIEHPPENYLQEAGSSSMMHMDQGAMEYQSREDLLMQCLSRKKPKTRERRGKGAEVYAKWINSLTPEQKEMVRKKNTENQRRRRMRLKLLKEGLQMGYNPYVLEGQDQNPDVEGPDISASLDFTQPLPQDHQ